MSAIPDTDGTTAGFSRWYSLILLSVVYALNFLDRQIMGILLESVRNAFDLADWQLGIIVGFGFALMYSSAGLIVAAFADRGNRVRIVAVAVSLWSIMTVLCGAASGSMSLLLARIGVGLGEAGGSPPTQSLISDIFPENERARALSLWALGCPAGTAAGVIGGAWIAEHYGWRMAFACAGAPGIVVGALILLTMRDRRPAQPVDVAITLGSVVSSCAAILRQPALLLSSTAAGIATMVSYCAVLWGPSYFMREYSLDQVTVSWFAAVALGGALALGTAAGGFLVHYLAGKNPSAYVDIPALGYLLAAPAYWLALSIHNAVLSAILLLIPGTLLAFWSGPVFAFFQNMAPPNARAMSTAVLFMVVNLIGLGVGPTLVGGLSSHFKTQYGLAGGLHNALLVVIATLIPAAALMWLSGRFLPKGSDNSDQR